MKKKKRSDLDRAADLLLIQAIGAPLDEEDQLWLTQWKALMQEVESVELAPTVMWVGGSYKKGKKAKEEDQ
jgi:hypothetical protein